MTNTDFRQITYVVNRKLLISMTINLIMSYFLKKDYESDLYFRVYRNINSFSLELSVDNRIFFSSEYRNLICFLRESKSYIGNFDGIIFKSLAIVFYEQKFLKDAFNTHKLRQISLGHMRSLAILQFLFKLELKPTRASNKMSQIAKSAADFQVLVFFFFVDFLCDTNLIEFYLVSSPF